MQVYILMTHHFNPLLKQSRIPLRLQRWLNCNSIDCELRKRWEHLRQYAFQNKSYVGSQNKEGIIFVTADLFLYFMQLLIHETALLIVMILFDTSHPVFLSIYVFQSYQAILLMMTNKNENKIFTKTNQIPAPMSLSICAGPGLDVILFEVKLYIFVINACFPVKVKPDPWKAVIILGGIGMERKTAFLYMSRVSAAMANSA